MSNTYYKYRKIKEVPPMDKIMGEGQYPGYTIDSTLSLTAYADPKEPNSIQLTVETKDTLRDGLQIAYIHLTAKEQDELIAGILERRGMQMAYGRNGLQIQTNLDPITATGEEKSIVHPPDIDY